jgi:hypothetical protein
MTLTDIFSIPFLICLSISILLIGCSSIYFYQKISQQDHKISSMIALISSMAQENQAMHSMIQNRPTAFVQSHPLASKGGDGGGEDDIHLIHVSDDEDDDDDTSSEDTSSDDDSDDENESVHSSTSGSSESPSETGFKINILDSLEESQMNLTKEVFDELSDDDDFEDDDANSSVLSLQNVMDLEEVLPEIINISEDIVVEEEKEKETDKTNIKSINILNPDENVDTKTSEAVDYKKMSITKLREIISKKGVTDASKLKKNDILKLLGVEQ